MGAAPLPCQRKRSTVRTVHNRRLLRVERTVRSRGSGSVRRDADAPVEAKATVSKLVEDGGLRPVDAGPLRRARELEAAGLLHMSVQGTLGTGLGSALKILS